MRVGMVMDNRFRNSMLLVAGGLTVLTTILQMSNPTDMMIGMQHDHGAEGERRMPLWTTTTTIAATGAATAIAMGSLHALGWLNPPPKRGA